MVERSWVRIPAPYSGWTCHFFTLICGKNCTVCLKDPKKEKNRPGLAHFFKKNKVYRFFHFVFLPIDGLERQVLEYFMLLFGGKKLAVDKRDSLDFHRQVLQGSNVFTIETCCKL